ncbi:hypothetical protein [Pararobbsia alpina]|uniref:Uncharacterized protein n=1 Tax=Pararobbsia alpina TaxID=621374 RepID=A0A6S7BN10_9BURK|nr:hypothetical protein [Pararobbsia alpina]CAB3806715.1 hypothetical protein LMG28138_05830 [Pararobbsia alpina]
MHDEKVALDKAQAELKTVIELAARKGGLDAAAQALARYEGKVVQLEKDETARVEKSGARAKVIAEQADLVRKELQTLSADDVVGPLNADETALTAAREILNRLDGQIDTDPAAEREGG